MLGRFFLGSGGGIRTPDLWVMSPTSCRCSTPRRVSGCGALLPRPLLRGWGASAAASPPKGSPPQYSPALRWVTTGFGMGPGGASTLSATDAPHPPSRGEGGPLLPHSAPPPRAGSLRPSASWRVAHAPCTLVSLTHHIRERDLPCRTRKKRREGSAHAPVLRRGVGSPLPGAGRPGPAATPRGVPERSRNRSCEGYPPSTIRTAWLQSVARGPPAAYRPGHLPGVLPLSSGDARLGEGFPLRCFQRFARPHVATQRCRGCDNWHTSGASTPVLSY